MVYTTPNLIQCQRISHSVALLPRDVLTATPEQAPGLTSSLPLPVSVCCSTALTAFLRNGSAVMEGAEAAAQ
eukprot:23091-Eustigmatos_ZCMA.PRE.1